MKNSALMTSAAKYLFAVLLLSLSMPSMAVDAGRFFIVVGKVQIKDANGKTATAIRGTTLRSGDTVITGKTGFAQLRMADEGLIAVRANTEFKLDDYNFQPEEPSVGRMFVNLLRGSFRSITGLIGKRNRSGYRIRTPTATMGVRGTDHETTVILTARDGFAPGTFDVVFVGGTTMTTARGKIDIAPNQAGYVGAINSVPKVINIPKFLQPVKQAARAPTARAATKGRSAGKTKTAAPADGKTSTTKDSKSRTFLINPLSSPRARTSSSLSKDQVKDVSRALKLDPKAVRSIDSEKLQLSDPSPLKPTSPSPKIPLSPTSPSSKIPLSPTAPPKTPIMPTSPLPKTPIMPMSPLPKAPIVPLSPLPKFPIAPIAPIKTKTTMPMMKSTTTPKSITIRK